MPSPRGVRALLLGASFVLLAFLSISLSALARAPRLGVELAWDDGAKAWTVGTAEPWSVLRPGDAIVRIGDEPATFLSLLTDNVYLESRDQAREWFAAKTRLARAFESRDVEVVVTRAGATLSLRAVPRKTGLAYLNRVESLHLIVGLVFFLIGAGVVARRGLDREARVLGGLCASMTLVYVTNAVSLLAETVYAPPLFVVTNVVNMAVFFIAPATLLHFACLLPRRRRFLERVRAIVPAYYVALGACLAFLSLPAINVCVAVFFVGTLVVIAHGFLAFREPLERQQMKWVAAAFGFGVGPWVLVNGLPLLATGHRLMNDTLPGACFIAIPIGLAFAIQKHRLLDIDALFRGTFVYVLTLAVVGVVDVGLLALFGTRFGESLGVEPVGRGVVRFLVAISVYAPARDAVRTTLRRALGRNRLDPMTVVDRLADRASGKAQPQVLEALSDMVGELFAPSTRRWIREDDEPSHPLLAALAGRRTAVALWEEPELGRLVPDEQALVLVPIHRGSEVFAVLVLGALPRRRFYGREDMALLATLGRETELLLENARLFEDIVAQTRAGVARDATHLAEREAILRELHDGLGGIATGIALLADAGRRTGSPESASRTLASISELARDHVSEIRGFMQDLEVRPTSWRNVARDVELLCRRMTNGQGIELRFVTDVSPTSPPPDALVDFHLRRIVKEACTNTVKHAEAKVLRVELAIQDRELRLLIADDGCGLGTKGTASDGGHGVVNMRQRAESLGGALSVAPSPEGGTALRLALPLAPPSASKIPVRLPQLPLGD